MELSKDQKLALDKLLYWYKNKLSPFVTVGGYAGTGKTTILAFVREKLHDENPKLRVAFCSYTGKATQVLKSKLVEKTQLKKQDFIGTIHSLIYETIEDDRGIVIGWRLKDPSEVFYSLIIVDEASMVDEKIWADMLSFRIPVIAVGDHGQLPPINGNFNLMRKPHIKLEQIHRQAKENPIIQVSIWAREEGRVPYGRHGHSVEKVEFAEAGSLIEEIFYSYNPDTLILCGYNNTRVKINNAIRGHLGFESKEPKSGDRIICLRNNKEKGVFNGMHGVIESIDEFDDISYSVVFTMEGADGDMLYEGRISKDQFNSPTTLNNLNGSVKTQGMDLFDFGYALTVHKAQGSQARKVVLFEERFKNQDEDMWRRWLYTAVTRAEEQLLIFG